MCWDHFLNYFMYEWGVFSFPDEVFEVWRILAPILGQQQFSLISRSPQGQFYPWNVYLAFSHPTYTSSCRTVPNSYFILSTPGYLQTACCKPGLFVWSTSLTFPVGKWDKNERWSFYLSAYFYPEWDCWVFSLTYGTYFRKLSSTLVSRLLPTHPRDTSCLY